MFSQPDGIWRQSSCECGACSAMWVPESSRGSLSNPRQQCLQTPCIPRRLPRWLYIAPFSAVHDTPDEQKAAHSRKKNNIERVGKGNQGIGQSLIYFSTYLPIYLSIYLSIYPCIHLSICASIHPPTHPLAHPPTDPATHPATQPSIHPSMHPPMHPPIHPSTQPASQPAIHPSSYTHIHVFMYVQTCNV